MKKKFLALFMAVCLAVSLVPAAVAAENENSPYPTTNISVWDGTATAGLTADGNGVYQLNSAADLSAFANLVNGGNTDADASLNVNVNLDGNAFIPIGAYATKNGNSNPTGNYYEGEFDGNGYTIFNGSIKNTDTSIYNRGIFGLVWNGYLHDLNVQDVSVYSNQTANEASTGAVAGIIFQSDATNLTAIDCTVEGTHRVGGVIGSVRDECTVTNCDNVNTAVKGNGMYTGGVIGASHDIKYGLFGLTGAPATIKNCDNSGTVNGTTEVGGIVGYSDQASISDCNNTGDVTSTGNYGTGGILGFDAYNPRFLYSPSTGSTVTNCTNSGDITGNTNGSRVAGIVGTLGVTPGEDAPRNEKTLTKIIGCSNTGDIIGTDGKCGTIFGYQITYKSGDADDYIDTLIVKISDCTAGGTVNGVTTSDFTSSRFIEE